MAQVIFAPSALRDLHRLRDFLRPKSDDAARRAGRAIMGATRMLAAQPFAGRYADDLPPEFRDWLIDFGNSGYVARYHIGPDVVTILAIRHQREVGF